MKRKTCKVAKQVVTMLLCAGLIGGSLPMDVLAEEIQTTQGNVETGEEAGAETEAQAEPEPGVEEEAVTPLTDSVSDGNVIALMSQSASASHIATYVGKIPQGIEWETGVKEDTFGEAYSTVTAKAADGTTYTVEVVPEGIVYFIDNVTTNFSEATTEPFEAVKTLAGSQLVNTVYDQQKTTDNTWGLVDTDARTKGYNDITSDKTATGIYGNNNAVGETLSYALYLEAGTYTITSGHREWWSNTRPMDVLLKTDAGETTIGRVSVSKNVKSAQFSYTFTLDTAQTITYTLKSTASQAPVVSWIGVSKYTVNESEYLGQALEDNDQLTVRSGAALEADSGTGKQLSVTGGWVSGGISNAGATIKDAPSLFQRKQFTLNLNLKYSYIEEGTGSRAAVFIGNSDATAFRMIPAKTKEQSVLRVGANSVAKDYLLSTALTAGQWHALSVVYTEDDQQGYATVYCDGAKVLDATGIGFKLSSTTNLETGIGASYGTSYLCNGTYDNIVVNATAATEEEAIAETQARLEAINSITQTDGNVVISGTDVDKAAKNINGLTYKGFGMLNGNSTSNLLLDYKAEHPDKYWEMMQYLFGGDYPLFTHIKMEMGNDGNNSTGAEACTMRYEDEEADASRSPGFVMAADAKMINPNVKISILRWEMPAWVSAKWKNNTGNQGYEAVYKWYKETIFDAYEKYGYIVDFIDPDKNETTNPNEDFIKWFANRVENETEFPSYMDEESIKAYHNIRIIASDENKSLQIVPSMRSDSELYNAVDIIGFHYRTSATDDYIKMADVDDKEVWYSEGCATFGYTELQENKTSEYGSGTIGGYQSPLALADSFINAFTGSRRTHYIFQPAIGSFYEGIQYGHKELLSARDPWSGYIHYDPALYMIAHFAQFAVTGWEDTEPSQNEIWRVITNATSGSFGSSDNEHQTAGIDGKASYMTLAAPDKEDFSIIFVNNTKNEKTFKITVEDMAVASGTALKIWTTTTDKYLQKNDTDAEQKDGGWYVTVPAYGMVTATTLDTTPARTPEEEIHNADRTVLDTDSTGRRQDTTDNVLYADDFEYAEEPALEQYNAKTKVTTSVDYLTARGNEPRYFLDTHGAYFVENGKLKADLSTSVGQWNGGEPSTIVGDFRWMDYTSSLDVQIPNASADTYARLGIRTQTGMNWNQSGYTLEINGVGSWKLYRVGTAVANGSAEANADGRYQLKLAALGDTITAFVDGTQVTSYQDSTPMLSGRIKISNNWKQVYYDNLLVEKIAGGTAYALSMIDGQDDSVSYEGDWTIDNPGSGSADNWYRTVSVSNAAGASLSFPVYGAGFAIIGPNSAGTKLDIYVDNALVAENAETKATSNRYESYSYSGLALGSHTVKVVVKSGTLKVAALYALGESTQADENALVSVETTFPDSYAVVQGQTINGLPETVQVKTGTGSVVTKPVIWSNNTAEHFTAAYETTSVTGVVQEGVNSFGAKLSITIPVEVVPKNVVYYIDMVKGTPDENAATESFAAIKALRGGALLNQAADQLKTDSNTWGLVDTDAGTKGYTDTKDKTATGIYGANNASGETLSYQLTLEPGTYTITSAHREWWGMTRPMKLTVTVDDIDLDAGTIQVDSSNTTVQNSYSFSVGRKQTITYTITATGTQAPVVSWLAVCRTGEAQEQEPYDSIPGTTGSVIRATNGKAMQAHGGSAAAMKEGTGEGCVNMDLDGDGEITEGKRVYLWYGEDKTNNTRPVDGVRCYVSTDLYNWTDRGTVLYLQSSILPIEASSEKAVTSSAGANGTGTTQDYPTMQLSSTNYEQLKAWGKLSQAPEGVTEKQFKDVKQFLRAYVTEFEKEPVSAEDITWIAKSYDETPIEAASFLYPDSTTQGTQIVSRLQLAFEGLYGNYCITERPKMVYNEKTGKFVIIFHADGPLYNNEKLYNWVKNGLQGNCDASRYSRAMVGFAVSDTPFGPFELVNITRMNYDESLNAQRLGEARDMTVFVDDVDADKDGAKDAYVIYSSEMNAKLYASLLNSEYTGPTARGNEADETQMAARLVSDNSREAPALLKYDGWYYMITSGTDGWNSTAHTYYRSRNILSGWEKVGNPAKNDTGKCFDTQVTYIIPLDAEAGRFIYMGDRWNGNKLSDSRTVWLPMQVNATDHTISILNRSSWKTEELDELLPVTVKTALPEVTWTDGNNLPEKVTVIYKGQTMESKVAWEKSSYQTLGTASVTGKLTDCGNVEISAEMLVCPRNAVYFVNASKDPVSEDYTAIMEKLSDTIQHTADRHDGAYSEETGFGYVGAEGKLRNSTDDIYQSLRYAASKTGSISYRFDLETGKYNVYVGMFDPSSWYDGKRYADVKINDEIVTEKYHYQKQTPETLVYEAVEAGEDGTLTVTITPNAATSSAVQVSFIVVTKMAEEIPEPSASPEPGASPEPTGTPEPSASPEPAGTPEPSASPEPTETPETSASPKPAETPEPSVSPEPAGTPEPSASPEPAETPVPTVSPATTNAPQDADTPSASNQDTSVQSPDSSAAPKATAASKAAITPVPSTAKTPQVTQQPQQASTKKESRPVRVNNSGEAKEEGWANILNSISRDLAAGTANGSEKQIVISMGEDAVLPAEILEAVKGTELSLRLEVEKDIVWTINGQTVSEIVGDIDFGVIRSADTIPAKLIEETAAGQEYVPLSLAHDGSFGMTAVLSMRLGADRIGKYANLFYYNPEKSSMEFVDSSLVAENGWAELIYEHASDYLLVMSDKSMKPDAAIDETVQEASEKSVAEPQQQKGSGWIWILIVIVLAASGGMAVYFRKKK